MRCVIYGASGLGKTVADIPLFKTQYIGFIDNFLKIPRNPYLGYPLLANELTRNLISAYQLDACIIAIGHNRIRAKIFAEVESLGLFIPTVISPQAWISPSAGIGRGCIIMAGANVGSDAILGNGCILNTGASLDHDSAMEDFTSLMPGARVAGNSRVGEGSAICMGAMVPEGRKVGRDTVVGALSFVHRDLPDRTVCLGRPARVLRSRTPEEPYTKK